MYFQSRVMEAACADIEVATSVLVRQSSLLDASCSGIRRSAPAPSSTPPPPAPPRPPSRYDCHIGKLQTEITQMGLVARRHTAKRGKVLTTLLVLSVANDLCAECTAQQAALTQEQADLQVRFDDAQEKILAWKAEMTLSEQRKNQHHKAAAMISAFIQDHLSAYNAWKRNVAAFLRQELTSKQAEDARQKQDIQHLLNLVFNIC